jgi:hypothetical protein
MTNIFGKSEDDLLNDMLTENHGSSDDSDRKERANQASCGSSCCDDDYDLPGSSAKSTFEFRQWQIGANDTFRPAGVTRETIPPGVYTFDRDDTGLLAKRIKVITDSLIELPDNSSERVLAGMAKFWDMEERYRKHGLLYKRGILLWGPPGSGKTATLTLLNKYLLDNGGIVIMCDHPKITSMGLEALRRIEPNRRIICIMEDIDEIIEKYGEHDLLALLDGENQVDRIVMLATTNYPDRLGARIINRPSRFDERILVDMPSKEARNKYLHHILGADVEGVEKWVADTEGLSIAHLREFVAAVKCLDQEYDVVLARLKSMKQKIKSIEGQGNKTGF